LELGSAADPLTELLRNGARALLPQAIEGEVAALLGCHADKLTDQRLVRHGHLPERKIVTGIDPVASLRSRRRAACEVSRRSARRTAPMGRHRTPPGRCRHPPPIIV
jgi:hypothetical protein